MVLINPILTKYGAIPSSSPISSINDEIPSNAVDIILLSLIVFHFFNNSTIGCNKLLIVLKSNSSSSFLIQIFLK